MQVLAYWICLYIPPILWENLLWRRPVSAGPSGSYSLRDWDKRRRLPVGWAAMASWAIVRRLLLGPTRSEGFSLTIVSSP